MGETFDFCTYKTLYGVFDSIVSLDTAYTYTVTYDDVAGVGTLTVGPTPIPEAGTVVSLSLLLCGAGVVVRRQRRQA